MTTGGHSSSQQVVAGAAKAARLPGMIRPIAGTVSALLSGNDASAPVELEAKAFLPFPDQFFGAADLGNTGWTMLVQAEVTQGSENA